MKPGHVYIMTNKPRGTLYIGVTADLIRRVSEHKQRVGSKFSRKYNLDKPVWHETFDDIADAIQRETSLKRWLRDWKITLIETNNPEWKDLFSEIHGANSRESFSGLRCAAPENDITPS
jgi:putative endonuclease